MRLTKRLRKLEDSVLKLPKLGTTKLYLKGGEANLLEQCKRIMMNWHQGGDVTSEQEVLLERLSGIAWLRAIDIFRSVVGTRICRGDALAEFGARVATGLVCCVAACKGQQRREYKGRQKVTGFHTHIHPPAA